MLLHSPRGLVLHRSDPQVFGTKQLLGGQRSHVPLKRDIMESRVEKA